MGELGVYGNGDNFASDFSEFLGLVIEGDDFSGADEGEVKGVEELSVEPGGGNESWGRFSDE